MSQEFSMTPIAHIRSDFAEKFGVPRQSGLVEELEADIVFEPAYQNPDALRAWRTSPTSGSSGSLTGPSGIPGSPTVRPPRLGGNTRMGVFATRSPFRPNPIALSWREAGGHPPDGRRPRAPGPGCGSGKRHSHSGHQALHPLRRQPSRRIGRLRRRTGQGKPCLFPSPQPLLAQVPAERQEALRGVLAQDPRPHYQKDPERVYGFSFAGFEVRFTVDGDQLTVRDIRPAE